MSVTTRIQIFGMCIGRCEMQLSHKLICFLYEPLVHEDLHFFKDLFNLLKLDTSVCVEALKVPNYNIE